MKKPDSTPHLMVDRSSFKAYVSGVLLARNGRGEVVVGDRIENDKALRALKAGKTIGLLVGGRLVSTMRLGEGGLYVEKPVRAAGRRKP